MSLLDRIYATIVPFKQQSLLLAISRLNWFPGNKVAVSIKGVLVKQNTVIIDFFTNLHEEESGIQLKRHFREAECHCQGGNWTGP